jgi:hypothetical protein
MGGTGNEEARRQQAEAQRSQQGQSNNPADLNEIQRQNAEEAQRQAAKSPEQQQEEWVEQAEKDRSKAHEDLEAAKAKTQAEARQAGTSDTGGTVTTKPSGRS